MRLMVWAFVACMYAIQGHDLVALLIAVLVIGCAGGIPSTRRRLTTLSRLAADQPLATRSRCPHRSS